MLVTDLPVQCGFLAAAAISLERQRPPAGSDSHRLVPQALTCGSTSFFPAADKQLLNLFHQQRGSVVGLCSPMSLKGFEML